MQIPLPTDNIYKFHSLFGLSIVVFFAGLLVVQYRSVNEAIQEANITAANAYVEISRLEVFLEMEDEFISKGVDSGIIKPSKHTIPDKYPNNLLEIVFYVPKKDDQELIKTVRQINDALEKQAFGHVKAKFALRNAEKLISDLHQLIAISLFFIASGIFQYIHGFKLWMVRTQAPIDKQVKGENNA